MNLAQSPIGKRILKLAYRKRIIRPRDLQAQDLPASYLWHLEKEGHLVKLERGTYLHPEAPLSEHLSLLEVGKRVPKGIFCLLSALNFHEITTQNPSAIWVALPPGAYRPKMESLSLQYFYFSGKALTEGIETHKIDGMKIQVYSPAKTVADCFKFRNQVGLDVALEALKEGLKEKRFTAEELRKYAKINRVDNFMRPYMEMVWI